MTESINNPAEASSKWLNGFDSISTNANDGAQNTTNIINAPLGRCSVASDCAAFRCRNLNGATPEWYLPAQNELLAIQAALCPNSVTCNFGSFASGLYWDSTQAQFSSTDASLVEIPQNSSNFVDSKTTTHYVRCIRAFTP